jgi:hypothetical protein
MHIQGTEIRSRFRPDIAEGRNPLRAVTFRPRAVIDVTSTSTVAAAPVPTCTGITFCEQ